MRCYLELLTELGGLEGCDPRHVLAYILTGHPTLGHLTRDCFRAEIKIATQCVHTVGPFAAERSAKSWGL
jgi:hypothetical protein